MNLKDVTKVFSEEMKQLGIKNLYYEKKDEYQPVEHHDAGEMRLLVIVLKLQRQINELKDELKKCAPTNT